MPTLLKSHIHVNYRMQSQAPNFANHSQNAASNGNGVVTHFERGLRYLRRLSIDSNGDASYCRGTLFSLFSQISNTE